MHSLWIRRIVLIVAPIPFEILNREIRSRIPVKRSDDNLGALVFIRLHKTHASEPDMQKLQKYFRVCRDVLTGSDEAVDRHIGAR